MKILETFLKVPENEKEDTHKKNLTICVRKRMKEGFILHNYEKRYQLGGERIQEMRSITARKYLELLDNSSESRAPILKERVCFLHDT